MLKLFFLLCLLSAPFLFFARLRTALLFFVQKDQVLVVLVPPELLDLDIVILQHVLDGHDLLSRPLLIGNGVNVIILGNDHLLRNLDRWVVDVGGGRLDAVALARVRFRAGTSEDYWSLLFLLG